MNAVILSLVSLAVAAYFAGVNVIGLNDGQRGVRVVQGQPTGELVEPGVHVSVDWWHEIAVVNWGIIRASVFQSVQAGVPARFAGVPVWLKWRVQHADVLKFHRVAGGATPSSDRTAEDVVIRPAFEAALQSQARNWEDLVARMNKSLQAHGIVVLSIDPK